MKDAALSNSEQARAPAPAVDTAELDDEEPADKSNTPQPTTNAQKPHQAALAEQLASALKQEVAKRQGIEKEVDAKVSGSMHNSAHPVTFHLTWLGMARRQRLFNSCNRSYSSCTRTADATPSGLLGT